MLDAVVARAGTIHTRRRMVRLPIAGALVAVALLAGSTWTGVAPEPSSVRTIPAGPPTTVGGTLDHEGNSITVIGEVSEDDDGEVTAGARARVSTAHASAGASGGWTERPAAPMPTAGQLFVDHQGDA